MRLIFYYFLFSHFLVFWSSDIISKRTYTISVEFETLYVEKVNEFDFPLPKCVCLKVWFNKDFDCFDFDFIIIKF